MKLNFNVCKIFINNIQLIVIDGEGRAFVLPESSFKAIKLVVYDETLTLR